MQLYILRHGIAEEGVPGQPDSERALTQDGKKKLRSVLKHASQVGVSPTLILTSPFRRAMETAQLAAELLRYQGSLVKTGVLIPSGKPESVWDEVRVHKDETQVLLSGHDPLFSYLTGYLLGCASLRVDFKKGAIIRIDLDGFSATPRGTLKWMLVPKLAR